MWENGKLLKYLSQVSFWLLPNFLIMDADCQKSNINQNLYGLLQSY